LAASKREKRLAIASNGRSKNERKSLPAVERFEVDSKPFAWSVAEIDHEYRGAWDWDLAPKETRDLLDLLNQYGNMTWGEVKGLLTNSKNKPSRKLNHAQAVETLTPEARDRLKVIGREDQEQLFRLRRSNLIRIWGALDRGVFVILWFDREHAVYRSND
jgi:hypothetical protein